jgi:hypothetical protein
MTPDEINKLIEQHVFGDDLRAKTDEQISAAINVGPGSCISMLHPSSRRAGLSFGKYPNRKIYDLSIPGNYPEDLGLWIWNNRIGQPWQADLESHVEQYRRTPRDFYHSPQLMFVLFNKLIEINDADGEPRYAVSLSSIPGGWNAVVTDREKLLDYSHQDEIPTAAVATVSLKAFGVDVGAGVKADVVTDE